MPETGQYYEFPTESPQVIKELLEKQLKAPPNRVLSVVGALWPVFFQDLYPNAKVQSFDANLSQIQDSRDEIKEATKRNPILADVRSEKFENLLSWIETDERVRGLLFLSNIPNYLTSDEAMMLAENIADTQVRFVLFSSVNAKYLNQLTSKNTRAYDSAPELAHALQEQGYKITEHKENPATGSQFGVCEFYLAILPKPAKHIPKVFFKPRVLD